MSYSLNQAKALFYIGNAKRESLNYESALVNFKNALTILKDNSLTVEDKDFTYALTSHIANSQFSIAKNYQRLNQSELVLKGFVEALKTLKDQNIDSNHSYTSSIISGIEKTCEELHAKAKESFKSNDYQAVLDISTLISNAMNYTSPEHSQMPSYIAYQGVGHFYLGKFKEALEPLKFSLSITTHPEDAGNIQSMINHCDTRIQAAEDAGNIHCDTQIQTAEAKALSTEQLKSLFTQVGALEEQSDALLDQATSVCQSIGYNDLETCRAVVIGDTSGE